MAWAMPTVFSGTHPHKVEPRGRVSIPSDFRRVLREAEAGELMMVPQLRDDRAHMFFTEKGLRAYVRSFDDQDLDAEGQRAIDDAITGEARALVIDDMGRIVIPEEYRTVIGVTADCVFVGGGSYFEMWEPAALAEYRRAQRELARGIIRGNRIRELPI